MTTTIGVMKQLSDQPGTVRAAVLLSSDKALADPLSELAAFTAQVYKNLGLTKEYFVSSVFLVQVAKSNTEVYGYSFSLKFAKPGVKLDVVQGPQGEKGEKGGAGPRGPEGPEGPSGSLTGPASGDLGGEYPSPAVVALQGTPVDDAAPANGQLLTYVEADGKWEPKDPPEGVTFDAVKTALSTASTSVSFNSQKITSVTDPGDPQDVATKHYADGVAQGLDLKPSVMVVGTEELTTLAGLENMIDDVLLDTDGMRVLLVGQGMGIGSLVDNGIWTVHAGVWTRPTDFADGSHVAAAYTFVQEGIARAHTGWVCMNDAPNDVVGASELAFTQFSAAGAITFGGDLSGVSGSQNVIRIQNQNVDGAVPAHGQTLVWRGMRFSSWTPAELGRASVAIMPMVAGLHYANNVIYDVLGSGYSFNTVSSGHGTAIAALNAVINVPDGSTAKVQIYNATTATTVWESDAYVGPLSGYEINQLVELSIGYSRYEFWQSTPTGASPSSCSHASISLYYDINFGEGGGPGPVG